VTAAIVPLALWLSASPAVRDINGAIRTPLKAAPGKVAAVFFITTDCPVANAFAPEIRRICQEYPELSCSLIYVDPRTTDAEAAKHSAEFGHVDYPRIVDRRQEVIRAAGAAITPEAVLVKDEAIVYRGQIDNRFAAWGKKRRAPTEFPLRDAVEALRRGQAPPRAQVPGVGCYIADLTAITSK
jgi:thiol-disulfide isomerase/thioredoxin